MAFLNFENGNHVGLGMSAVSIHKICKVWLLSKPFISSPLPKDFSSCKVALEYFTLFQNNIFVQKFNVGKNFHDFEFDFWTQFDRRVWYENAPKIQIIQNQIIGQKLECLNSVFVSCEICKFEAFSKKNRFTRFLHRKLGTFLMIFYLWLMASSLALVTIRRKLCISPGLGYNSMSDGRT